MTQPHAPIESMPHHRYLADARARLLTVVLMAFTAGIFLALSVAAGPGLGRGISALAGAAAAVSSTIGTVLLYRDLRPRSAPQD